MTYQGIDTAAKLTEEHANNAIRAKISFVGRYLVPATGTVAWKALTEDEANILRNAGLAILLCWELGASDIRYGGSKGSDHGIRARSLAEAMGVPYGTVIYFAADYDVPDYDLGMCGQYLKSAALTLGPYKIGVYGGEKIVKYCLDNHVCNYAWQCVAWTKNYHVNANVRQYAWQGDKRSKEIAAKIDTDPNFAVDLDSCEDMNAAGLWMPKKPEPVTHWYDDTVKWALKEGIVTDTRPEDLITRAEVMQMIRNYNRRFEEEDSKSLSGILGG